jgi:AcrR family transcriptional regulator
MEGRGERSLGCRRRTGRRVTNYGSVGMARSSAKPRRYAPRMPPEERREQLLDATLTLIAERGYESVSMEGVARQAGVTKPVLYDLFGSLAALLDALLDREHQRALLQLSELMPTPGEDADPAQVLVEALDAFLRAIETRPDAWRLSLMPIEAQPGIVRKHVERDRTAVAKQLASIVRWGVEQLEVPISDVDLLVQTIIVLAEQGGRMHLDDPERYSRERITAFTASLLDSVRN